MNAEGLLELGKWIVLVILGYLIIPMRNKVDRHAECIAKYEAYFEGIQEDLKEIKEHLKEINGNIRKK